MFVKDYADKKNWNSYIHKKKFVKSVKKEHNNHNNMHKEQKKGAFTNNNFSIAVYYGLLFIFFFGFLFFLSITFSYASAKDDRASLEKFNDFTVATTKIIKF